MIGFTSSQGYTLELFQFLEIVFNQVSPFVAMTVKVRWEFSVGFRRNYRLNPRRNQIFAEPVGVKSPISKEYFAGNALDQLGGFAQIMGLSGHQAEADKVTERIRQRQYFGGNSAA